MGRNTLRGCLTEHDLLLAELEFPGLIEFYLRSQLRLDPPLTFLDLLAEFGSFTAPPRPGSPPTTE